MDCSNKMKKRQQQQQKQQQYYTALCPELHRKTVERGKIDTYNTQIHGQSLSWLDTSILITKWRV